MARVFFCGVLALPWFALPWFALLFLAIAESVTLRPRVCTSPCPCTRYRYVIPRHVCAVLTVHACRAVRRWDCCRWGCFLLRPRNDSLSALTCARAAVMIGRIMGSAFACTHNSASCRAVYCCQHAFCVVLTKTFGIKTWASGPTYMPRWFHWGAPSGRVAGAIGGSTQHSSSRTSVHAEPNEPGINSKPNSSWCPLNPSLRMGKKTDQNASGRALASQPILFWESTEIML